MKIIIFLLLFLGSFISFASVELATSTVTCDLMPAGLEGAQWCVDGKYYASGASATLPVGTYTVTFKAVSGYTAPASQTVTVKNGLSSKLTVAYTQQTCTVTCSITPTGLEGAQWCIGGKNYASGTSATLPVGTYTVTFKDVTGYTAPLSVDFEMPDGGNIKFTAAYTQQIGMVTCDLAPAGLDGAQWCIDGNYYDSGASAMLPVGTYTVTFKAVSGYAAPGEQQVTVANGQSSKLTAAYTQQGGPWTSPVNYAKSMKVYAVVKLKSGAYLETAGSAIGVFDANGECRGVATLSTASGGAVVYSGQVWSDSASEKGFTLKLWNGGTKAVSDLNETIDFAQDSVYGSADTPVTFTEKGQTSDWVYSLDSNGNASITAYKGNAKYVSIPAELDGHPVAAIAAGAWGANSTVSSVTLPIGIEMPAESPFSGCASLTDVNYTLDGVRMDFGQGVTVNVVGVSTTASVVKLNTGWNLVALPQCELTQESQHALQSIGVYFGYDANVNIFFRADRLEPGRPYWIYNTGEPAVIPVK